MLIPVRCFTCGAVIADKYDEYVEKLRNGTAPSEALDELGFKRYCCRRMFLSHVDATDEVLKYGKF